MGSRLVKLTGTVEALGQAEIKPDCHVYSYVRFLEKDGTVVMKNKVVVANTVNSYLDLGVSGDFYMSHLGKMCAMYAAKTSDRKADDIAYFGRARSGALIKSAWWLVLGLITSFFIVGIPLVIFAIISMVGFSKWPKEQEMRVAAFT